ncbi:MAG: hypothetical protein HC911_14675 [Chloroflexaceae bacterium]|nr:hypothetical protein [Chloroflexaceae bacterium]
MYLSRWWTYQDERFPLKQYLPLVSIFTVAMLSVAAALRGAAGMPSLAVLLAATLSTLLLFLQLRIADEFKDYMSDCAYRRYLPVPRGVVRLRNLGWLGVAAAAVQLGLALWLAPAVLPWLLLVWGYMALMRVEFGISHWLRQRPLLYLVLHTPITPLIALYVSAWDWAAAGVAPAAGVGWLLLISTGCGLALEIGRKLRTPAQEEPGVETYSALWGAHTAATVWVTVLLLCGGGMAALLQSLHSPPALLLLPAALLLGAVVAGWRYTYFLGDADAKRLNQLSGVWVLAVYGVIGTAALLAG